MNTKKIFVAMVIIVAIAVGAYLTQQVKKDTQNQDTQAAATSTAFVGDVYTFVAPEGSFTVQYNADGDKAQINFNGTSYELNQAVSGSGAKYESADGKVLFWEHQGTAEFDIDGKPVFSEEAVWKCSADEPGCRGGNGDVGTTTTETAQDLQGTAWMWNATVQTDGTTITPHDAQAFVLTFLDGERFSATTDCNTIMGSYQVNGTSLTVGQVASTKKACPNAPVQESDFTKMVSGVSAYQISKEGQTTLTLTSTEGVMHFSATPVEENPQKYDAVIGMTETEAVAYAEKNDTSFRVIKKDGKSLPTTLDYRPGRINAVTEKGVVVEYSIEK